MTSPQGSNLWETGGGGGGGGSRGLLRVVGRGTGGGRGDGGDHAGAEGGRNEGGVAGPATAPEVGRRRRRGEFFRGQAAGEEVSRARSRWDACCIRRGGTGRGARDASWREEDGEAEGSARAQTGLGSTTITAVREKVGERKGYFPEETSVEVGFSSRIRRMLRPALPEPARLDVEADLPFGGQASVR